MATISKWEPFGVALDITATVASVTRTSASKYSVKFNVSWKTYWDGAETNFGMKASAGGASVVINAFGNYASSGSGTVTGTYDISGNGAATKSVSVAFQNYECDWQGNVTSSKSNSISLSVSVPAWTSYTVSYNANGGSGAPSAQTKWKDQTLTLSSTVPTRTGHTFKGWATSASGSVAYAAGGTVPASTNQNLTLYAVWQAYTYTVTYNANGGSGQPANQTKTYGVTLTLSSTKPTRTNYTFLGWSTSASGSVAYAAGGSYTSNANITLYAVWSLNYTKPRISSMSVYRCDSSGTASEDGTYAKVSVTWATDRSVSSISVSWSGGSTTISASGTGATSSKVVGGSFNVDSTYTFTVTVTDSDGSTSASRTMSSKAYPIDVMPDGKGIAFGKAAEAFNFDVNYNALIRGELKVMSGVNFDTYAKIAGRLHANDGINISDLRDYEQTPGMFGIQVFRPFFSAVNGYWKTILHFKGWTGGTYDTTQIALPADVSSDRHIRIRYGTPDGGWTGWKALLDSDNFWSWVVTMQGTRFENGWIGLYGSLDNAKTNTSRKGWIGHNGTTELYVQNEAGGATQIKTGNVGCALLSDRFRPLADNTLYLGDSSNRWKAVYAINGTIQTSDRNQKTDISEINQKYIDLFDRLQPVTFRFSDRGHDRVHIGFIAQDVKATMDELDILPEEFAAYCRDVKMETIEVEETVKDEDGNEQVIKSEKDVPVLDEDGNPIYLYSLRYTEFIALNTRMIQEDRKKIQEQQQEIDDLKERLAKLEDLLLKGDQHVTDS